MTTTVIDRRHHRGTEQPDPVAAEQAREKQREDFERRMRLRELRQGDYSRFKSEVAQDRRPQLEAAKESQVAELLTRLESLETAALDGAENAAERFDLLKQIVAVRTEHWAMMRDEGFRAEVAYKLGTELSERFVTLPTESDLFRTDDPELRDRHQASRRRVLATQAESRRLAREAERWELLRQMTETGETRRANSFGDVIERNQQVDESAARRARLDAEAAEKAARAAQDELDEIERTIADR